MRGRIAAAILMSGLVAGAAQAQSSGMRIDIPIREVLLDNGARLYSIPIKLGNTEIEAGLDTGSTGLRIMPGTLASGDAQAGGSASTYSFTSGVRYEGDRSKATLSVGGLSGPVSFEQITTLICRGDKPDCPATRTGPADYGVRGNSLTAGRFRALFGVNHAGTDIDNPFLALGVKRWIVTLPRPGETLPGHLILSPSDEEAAAFTYLSNSPDLRSRGGLRDAVTGCLIDVTTKKQSCGYAILDSGAPGLQLMNSGTHASDWTRDGPATLALYDGRVLRGMERFVLGRREQASLLRLEGNDRMRLTVIFAGPLPYFGFDVLYEAGGSRIGLKPRPAIGDGPGGQLAPPQ